MGNKRKRKFEIEWFVRDTRYESRGEESVSREQVDTLEETIGVIKKFIREKFIEGGFVFADGKWGFKETVFWRLRACPKSPFQGHSDDVFSAKR